MNSQLRARVLQTIDSGVYFFVVLIRYPTGFKLELSTYIQKSNINVCKLIFENRVFVCEQNCCRCCISVLLLNCTFMVFYTI